MTVGGSLERESYRGRLNLFTLLIVGANLEAQVLLVLGNLDSCILDDVYELVLEIVLISLDRNRGHQRHVWDSKQACLPLIHRVLPLILNIRTPSGIDFHMNSRCTREGWEGR